MNEMCAHNPHTKTKGRLVGVHYNFGITLNVNIKLLNSSFFRYSTGNGRYLSSYRPRYDKGSESGPLNRNSKFDNTPAWKKQNNSDIREEGGTI